MFLMVSDNQSCYCITVLLKVYFKTLYTMMLDARAKNGGLLVCFRSRSVHTSACNDLRMYISACAFFNSASKRCFVSESAGSYGATVDRGVIEETLEFSSAKQSTDLTTLNPFCFAEPVLFSNVLHSTLITSLVLKSLFE